ncbi:superoxide dismutase family protein [Legionella septentrionalis]|uniref:superoxide dismutase family protein n=1 Tax=Legionella septentrionalis TaxID=2498109 RepID=UPI000F8C3EE5|nr:superoxide dismutase family protein [Legionella septentrionalis]RUQ99928.1 superoxide dismutase [Legionella septentrionalis]RUR10228.1 superoxide dismutase [Legionella septentrionalis]RUR15760.1 superoxide dismutase [Legionella septentrionalis]
MNKWFFITALTFASLASHAEQVRVTIYDTTAAENSLGEIIFKDTAKGLLIIPDLHGLTPGLHGLHLHQHSNCAAHGMDAGEHFDPDNTKSHQGPYGSGHLGDLPVLYVTADGKATTPTLAPRLKTSVLKNTAVMIHAGGDNYSDNPKAGGGGDRIACGIVQSNENQKNEHKQEHPNP